VEGIWNLRDPISGELIRGRIEDFANGEGFQVREYSIQGNHIHLIVEAEDREALARGIKSLEIRLAIHLNRLMSRKGRVFADRYHQHILKTPTEVRRALKYVLQNRRKHAAEWGRDIPESWRDPYSSARYALAPARTYLLRRAKAELAPG
jgi:REP element-mobilizing transposase RayT